MSTPKKRLFAEALRQGANQKEAAIAAGYSEKTAKQAGSRLAKDPDVLAEIERRNAADAAPAVEHKEHEDPKAFLIERMNDESIDPRLRIDAAKALLPYLYTKSGGEGKKAAREEAAKDVAGGGKFGAGQAPKLRSVN